MKNVRTLRKVFLFALIALASSVIFLIIVKINWQSAIGKEADSKFRELFPLVHLNNEIEIVITPSVFNDQNQIILNFDLSVLNHTNEPIKFLNNGFGVVFYQYRSNIHEWEQIKSDVYPGTISFTLPPAMDKSDITEFWIVNGNSLQNVDYSQPVRIYVTGVGEISGILYGDYRDVQIKR